MVCPVELSTSFYFIVEYRFEFIRLFCVGYIYLRINVLSRGQYPIKVAAFWMTALQHRAQSFKSCNQYALLNRWNDFYEEILMQIQLISNLIELKFLSWFS